ncbi:hypothetical protein ScPMuIL_001726 [Solemya velum]
MDSKRLHVVVCGGGNGAHTFSCLASSRPNTEVRVLTLFDDEAERWAERLERDDMVSTFCNSDGSTTTVKSSPCLVTKDPKEASKDCNIIFFTVPAFAHEQYLESLVPFIPDHSLLVGMPGRAGFEFEVFHILKDKAKTCAIISFETLPWACRFLEFGHSVKVHGTKEYVSASLLGRGNFEQDPICSVQYLFGDKPIVTQTNNYLELNLLSKSIFHPSVMYGYWKDWNGVPLDESPLFYNGVDEKSVEVIENVDGEIMEIARKISELQPEMKMTSVISAYDWLVAHYQYQICDKTNLMTVFRTNKAYDGLRHPMRITKDGKYVPDFQSRYLNEDIPYGLVVIRGLASIFGVKTPVIDRVIMWCQDHVNKQYLVGLHLTVAQRRMDSERLRLVVCGGGNGAHTFSCLASSRPNTEVRVLTLFDDEAERWTERLDQEEMVLTVCNSDGSTTALKSRPSLVTNDPKAATADCSIVFFTVPAFAHAQYLESLIPYISDNSLIVGMPSQAGFEFQVFHILKDKAKSCTIVSFETLPWACRIEEFGHRVKVAGRKECVKASVVGGEKFRENALDLIQTLIGNKPVITQANNYLEINLLSKSTFHPPVMYGYWKDWDGIPVEEPPLFYNGIGEQSVGFLNSVDEEVMAIARKITDLRPDMKMPGIAPARDWLIEHYRYQIIDKTNLMTAFRTNKGYDGLTHPMKKTENGKYVPDFKARYVNEDIPYGLVVFRGLATIVGVSTPVIDEVITWCQGRLGRQYLVGAGLTGRDLDSTRAPQRFGFHTIADLMKIK